MNSPIDYELKRLKQQASQQSFLRLQNNPGQMAENLKRLFPRLFDRNGKPIRKRRREDLELDYQELTRKLNEYRSANAPYMVTLVKMAFTYAEVPLGVTQIYRLLPDVNHCSLQRAVKRLRELNIIAPMDAMKKRNNSYHLV